MYSFSWLKINGTYSEYYIFFVEKSPDKEVNFCEKCCHNNADPKCAVLRIDCRSCEKPGELQYRYFHSCINSLLLKVNGTYSDNLIYSFAEKSLDENFNFCEKCCHENEHPKCAELKRLKTSSTDCRSCKNRVGYFTHFKV